MQKNTQPGLLDKAVGLASATLRRIGFHFFSIIAALVFTKPILPEAIYTYAGLICVIPNGFTPKKFAFLTPAAAAGLFFCAAWLQSGVPAAVALFWAGFLSWLLQIAILRLRPGWAWSALPLLAVCLIGSSRSYPFPLPLFMSCTLGGLAFYALGAVFQNKKRLDKALTVAVNLLEPVLKLKVFPEAFDNQFRLLYKQSASFLQAGPMRKNKYAELLCQRLEELNPELAESVQWADERFTEREANSFLASLADMNALLDQVLREEREARLLAGHGKTPPAPQTSGEFAEFQTSAEQLLAKKFKLPEKLQQRVSALFISTQNIIVCMKKDPDDKPAGTRFLNRYLPAAHKAVDDYINLAAQGAAHENVKEVLAQCESLLDRLAGAFHEEHGNLLRNDAMRFTADLNVLDTLLKMDGR